MNDNLFKSMKIYRCLSVAISICYLATIVTINAVNIGICKLSLPPGKNGIASAIQHAMAPAVMARIGLFNLVDVATISVPCGITNTTYPIIHAVTKHAIHPLIVAFVTIRIRCRQHWIWSKRYDGIRCPTYAAMGSANDKHRTLYRAIWMGNRIVVMVVPSKK